MIGLVRLLFRFLLALFKSRQRLEAENAALRQQLIILARRTRKRPRLTGADRLVFLCLYRLFPSILDALLILKPETVLRWHRAGLRALWRWKSRSRGGRPKVPAEIRALIRETSRANPLWGAPRLHGELLKLGIHLAQSTVAKSMVRRRGPPSQNWATFLRNHAPQIAAIDLFVVPTLTFRLLYCLVILGHGRRQLIAFGVTAHPTAEWIARQITEAFPWNSAPKYLIRDRDRCYGPAFRARLRAMGIRDRPIAPRSPWQNGPVERLIGSIRRECLDHVVVLGKGHLRRIPSAYACYCNDVRTHLALGKDAPLGRAIQGAGRITAVPLLGGLHHQYVRT